MFASSATEIRTWNIQSLEFVQEFKFSSSKSANNKSHRPSLNSFVIKSDNSLIATVIDKSSIGIWDIETNKEYFLTEASQAKCCSFDNSSQDRYLAVGNSNGFIDIYDFKSQRSKKKTHKINSSSQVSVNCLSYNQNGRYIATGNSNGTIVIFNILTQALSKPLIYQHPKSTIPSNNSCSAIQFATNVPSCLACSYEDGSILLWDTNRDSHIYAAKCHTLPCTSLILSPMNDFFLVSGGLDGKAVMHDTRTNAIINSISCSGGVSSLDMPRNGSTLCIGTVNGSIFCYDLRSKLDEPIYSIDLAHQGPVNCVKFFQNTSSMAQSNSNNNSLHNNSTLLVNNRTVKKPTDSNMSDVSIMINDKTIKKSNSYNNDLQETINGNNNMKENGTASLQLYSPENSNNHHKYVKSYNTNLTILKESLNVQHNSHNDMAPHSTYDSFIIHQKKSFSTSSGHSSKSTSNLLIGNMQAPIIPNNNFNGTNNVIPNENINLFDHNQHNSTQVKQGKNFLSANVTKSRGFSTELYSPISNSQKSENPLSSNHQTNFIDDISPNHARTSSKQPDSSMQVDMIDISEHQQPTNNYIQSLNNSTKVLENDDHHNMPSQNDSMRNIIKETLKDLIGDFRDELMSENFRFKAEMIKEFLELKKDLSQAIETCSINHELVREIERLKDENKRLKKLF